ncbi:TonB-dependent receptor [Iodidimonas gelatinilytica]|nr:TonB-dependent receptor [Iodidimonas gelatinilytica]
MITKSKGRGSLQSRKPSVFRQRARAISAAGVTGLVALGSFAPAATLTALLASTVMTPAAVAQDFTTGQLVGVVTDTAGNPVSGIAVTISNDQTGFDSTSTTDAEGRFNFARLPIAQYKVVVDAPFGEDPSDEIRIPAGSVQRLNFTVATSEVEAAGLEEIIVVGTRATSSRKDFLGQEGGIVVNTDDLVARVPLQRTVSDIALLAPGASSGDSAFGNQPSLAGSSVAENLFYVNGYNATDTRDFIGLMNTIPFEFFQQVDIKTTGFQAEFGRTTGSVVNLVTRKGTNDFHVGANAFYTPEGLRSNSKKRDTTDGFRSSDKLTETEINTWISGPLIKDRLWFYGLVSFRDNDLEDFSNSAFTDRKDDDPVWGINIDGILLDNDMFGYHTFTYTHIDDKRDIVDSIQPFDRDTGTIDREADTVTQTFERGGTTDILKYTGVIRDWLSISGLFGESDSRGRDLSNVSDIPQINDLRSGTNIVTGNTGGSIVDAINNDNRRMWRADADITVNDFFGDHQFRIGFDREVRKSAEQTSFSGGFRYVVFADGSGLGRFDANGDGISDTGVDLSAPVIRQDFRTTGGSFESVLKGYYIQDRWQTPIENLTLNVGFRLEDQTSKNVNGEPFAEFNGGFDFRTGFTYELDEGRSRVYGFVGKTHFAIANNTNIRLAGEEIFNEDFFRLVSDTIDPANVDAAIGEFIGRDIVSPPGVQPASTLVDKDLENQRQIEYSLGYDFSVGSNWTFGVRGVYRDLGQGLEDGSMDAGFRQFAADNGLDVDAAAAAFTGFQTFALFNPGSDVTLDVRTDLAPADMVAFLGGDADGDGLVEATLTAEQIGVPKISRKYKALELTWERAFVDGWSFQGSYVLARSSGNTEGGVKSDNGQGDTGLTQDFDTTGLTDGAKGRLPNDRRHTIKAFGSYAATEQLTFGANLTVQSGRGFGCQGVHPTDGIAAQFGAASFFCKLDENNRPNADVESRLTPRGSVLESGWTKQLDVSAVFKPDVDFLPNGVAPEFRIDVFNIFDSNDVTDLQEFGEFDSGQVRSTFGDPTGFIQARTVRLSARIEF